MWEFLRPSSRPWGSVDIGSEPVTTTWTILPSASMGILCMDGWILPLVLGDLSTDGLSPVETDIGSMTVIFDSWDTDRPDTQSWEVG
jgi:hypothetical protein